MLVLVCDSQLSIHVAMLRMHCRDQCCGVRRMSKDAIFEPFFIANYNMTEVRSSISMLASLDFDKLFPSHDIGKGITQSDMQAWAVDLMA